MKINDFTNKLFIGLFSSIDVTENSPLDDLYFDLRALQDLRQVKIDKIKATTDIIENLKKNPVFANKILILQDEIRVLERDRETIDEQIKDKKDAIIDAGGVLPKQNPDHLESKIERKLASKFRKLMKHLKI
ncbi:MAG: hypothetical protein H0W88_03275 [Parachlamydiaceae bacterium]|nr:hypothetical protein [Parachlamydiaceae bacterium]